MVTIGILPSFLKRFFYRLKGAKIGKNVHFGLFSYINGKEVEIGDDSKISPFTFINVKRLKVGKRVQVKMMVAIDTGEVEIGDDSVIMEQVTVGGMLTPRSVLKIGKRVKIFPFSFLNPTEAITIADDVGVGGSNYIFTHASWLSVLDGFPVTFGPVSIERRVWLTWRVSILANVVIGEDSIIGAGSVVNRNIPKKSLASGSPAKVLISNGKFIREPSFEGKDKILRKIWHEFKDYEIYQGRKAYIEETTSDLRIYLKTKSKTLCLLYEKNDTAAEPKSDIYVCLSRISQKKRQEMTAGGIAWFDLEKREAVYSNTETWKEVKDFFGRYGIRFSILEKF
jgi:acetyltransferase-like isoleucine patch superfamily enzyme